jgi:hypothetical protein
VTTPDSDGPLITTATIVSADARETADLSANDNAPRPPLTPAAQRALQEAQERRDAALANAKSQAPEVGGRNGPDPVRYGDWESGGIAWDF